MLLAEEEPTMLEDVIAARMATVKDDDDRRGSCSGGSHKGKSRGYDALYPTEIHHFR